MKRLLAVLLAVCMVLSFCGCGAGETEKAMREAGKAAEGRGFSDGYLALH